MSLRYLFSGKNKRNETFISHLDWHGLSIEVSRKNMKSIRLKLSHAGGLRISCPHFVKDTDIVGFLNERQEWIANQQQKQADRQAQHNQSIVMGHILLWGEQHPIETLDKISVCKLHELSDNQLSDLKQKILKQQLKDFIAQTLPNWTDQMQVVPEYWNVRKMKTKWGSCNVMRKRIWLNTQLASYPKKCAEMVLVHELVHLIEPSHNKHFYYLMDSYLPDWRSADKILQNTLLSY